MASGTASPERTLSFLSQKYSYAYSSLASNGVLNITATNLKYTVPEGYTPFSFTQYATGNANVAVARIYPRSTGTVVTLRNRGSSAVSATFSITITFVPIDLVEDVSGKYSAEFTHVYTSDVVEAPRNVADFMFVDPTTRQKIDKLFFSPNEEVCVSLNKNLTYNLHQTLYYIQVYEAGAEEGTTYYTKASDFSLGRYYKSLTMPSQAITISARYLNGYFINISTMYCTYTLSPSRMSPVYTADSEITVTFSPVYGHYTISITADVELELVSSYTYKFIMPSRDVNIECTFS